MNLIDQSQQETVPTHVVTPEGRDIELVHVPKVGIHIDGILTCEYVSERLTGQLISYVAIKHAGEGIGLSDMPARYKDSRVYTNVTSEYNGILERRLNYKPFELLFIEEKGRKRLSGFVLRKSGDEIGINPKKTGLYDSQTHPDGKDPSLLIRGRPTKDDNNRLAAYIRSVYAGQTITVKELESWAAINRINGRSARQILEALCGVDVKKVVTPFGTDEAEEAAVFYTKL